MTTMYDTSACHWKPKDIYLATLYKKTSMEQSKKMVCNFCNFNNILLDQKSPPLLIPVANRGDDTQHHIHGHLNL